MTSLAPGFPIWVVSALHRSRVIADRCVSSLRLSAKSSGAVDFTTRRNAPLTQVGAPKPTTFASLATSTNGSAALSVPQVLEQLLEKIDLTEEQSEVFMDDLLSEADAAQISAFLTLLRAKEQRGRLWKRLYTFMITYVQITGLVKAMLRRYIPVKGVIGGLDIVGTGGDGANTVNISTGSAILAAASGAKVAKHGLRSSSSACGSADVLEALGVAINLGPEGVSKCVNELGIGFMLATNYHPAMKSVAPVRQVIKIKTAFNFIGPMLNPAKVPFAIVGVYSKDLVSYILLVVS
ncbi:unnamed protein product [Calypogeia fissa]